MLASGNGNPMQCVQNLVRITRGECTYDRIKGIEPSYVDRPEPVIKPLLIADAKWLIQTYEPRVRVDNIDIEGVLSEHGSFMINIDTTITG